MSIFLFLRSGTPSPSNAFLLPQWGGIVIYNPPPETSSHIQLTSSHLDPIFSVFSNQLLTLLGVHHLPPGVHAAISDPENLSVLTDWQLDSLLRRRALENTRGSQDTLRSIVKLVDQIENMPVGQYVKGDVQDALLALDKVCYISGSHLNWYLLLILFRPCRYMLCPPPRSPRPYIIRHRRSPSPPVRSLTQECWPCYILLRSTNMQCIRHCLRARSYHSSQQL
jgi:hypothetical protein